MPTVEIRRNSDGVVRTYEDKFEWDEGSDYLWGEGNYACDCNRYIFFCWAAGEPEDADRGCGDSAYSVRISEGGKVLYQDDDWDAALDEQSPAGHD